MTRLPNLGETPYKTILDSYLQVEHNADGTHSAITGTTFKFSATGPNVIGSATPNARFELEITGTFTGGGSGSTQALRIDPTLNVSANQNSAMQEIAGNFVKQAGTHNLFASLNLNPPNISGASGTVTNSAALFISGTPAGASNNYTMWTQGGRVRHEDGPFELACNLNVNRGSDFNLGTTDNFAVNFFTNNTTQMILSNAGVLTLKAYGTGTGVVTVGDPDSGGTGFRVLRVPN